MTYKEYNCGIYRKEIIKLLRKRLDIKDKIRYHKRKIAFFEKEELPKIEIELNKFLEKAKGKI